VGGTLVPVGGHNLLEPAALGVPVLIGPHYFNAEDIAEQFLSIGAAALVRDGAALGAELQVLLSDPGLRAQRAELARQTLDRNRGALQRLLALIEPVIEGAPGGQVSAATSR